MKPSTSLLRVIASAILLSSLFRSEPALAGGCSAPSFAAARTFGAGDRPDSVAIADFNGDGKPDLAVANDSFPGTVSILLAKGDATFQTAVQYSAGPGPSSVAVGDFNGDGKPDLAVANQGSFQNNFSDGGVSYCWVMAMARSRRRLTTLRECILSM